MAATWMTGPAARLRAATGGAGGWMLMAAHAVSGTLMLAWHVGVGHLLAPAEYGAAGALLGISVVLHVVGNAVMTSVVASVAATADHRTPWPLVRQWAGTGALVMVVALAASPFVDRALHLASGWPVVWLGGATAMTAIGIVPRGVLVGDGAFASAASAVAGGGAVRLGASLVFVSAHPRASSALAGAFAGEAATAAVAVVGVARRGRGRRGAAAVLTLVRGDTARTMLAFVGFYLLTTTDTMLARRLLDSGSSGRYVAASTLASIALFLPAVVAAPTYRSIAQRVRVRGDGPRAAAIPALAAAAIALPAAGVLSLVPGPLLRVAFGPPYADAAPAVRYLAASYACLAISHILLLYNIAAARGAAFGGLAAVLVLLLTVALHHDGPVAIASDALMATGALLIGLVAAAALDHRRSVSRRAGRADVG